MYKKHLKNSIDFIGSLIGLIFLSPILVIVTLLLTITNNGNKRATEIISVMIKISE